MMNDNILKKKNKIEEKVIILSCKNIDSSMWISSPRGEFLL